MRNTPCAAMPGLACLAITGPPLVHKAAPPPSDPGHPVRGSATPAHVQPALPQATCVLQCVAPPSGNPCAARGMPCIALDGANATCAQPARCNAQVVPNGRDSSGVRFNSARV